MSKKIIAALIAITLLFIGVFAACQKNEDTPSVYVEEDAYPFVTDEDGERVLDENGEYIVYHTDENGKIMKDANGNKVTQKQVFEPVSEHNRIEDYGYKIVLPDGWVSTITKGEFQNKKTGDLFTISPVKSSTYKQNYDLAKQICDIASEKDDFEAVLTDDITDFGEAYGNMFCLNVKHPDGLYIVYTFRNSGNLYSITYESENAETSPEICKNLMNGITFKPFQYYEVTTTEFTPTTTTTANTTTEVVAE